MRIHEVKRYQDQEFVTQVENGAGCTEVNKVGTYTRKGFLCMTDFLPKCVRKVLVIACGCNVMSIVCRRFYCLP